MTSWLQRRRERRRKRHRQEEIAAWFILPLVALVAWLLGAQIWGLVKEPAQQLLLR